MNAAQLQNTTHIPWAYHGLHVTFMLQQATCLEPHSAVLLLCIHEQTGIFVGCDKYQTRYTTWRRVLCSTAKTALCPWLSYSGITLWIDKVRTLSLINVYIQMSKRNCIHCFFTQTYSQTILVNFSAHPLASNLAASAYWGEWFPASCP